MSDPEFLAEDADERAPEPAYGWFKPLLLFVATVLSVFYTGALYANSDRSLSLVQGLLDWRFLASGAAFAVPLLAILLTHEFGHYFAARIHRVPASLPYFIPLPVISPAGTMGAVISMRGAIRSRNALLDIGAAGPLAGLVVAIPALLWGLSRSPVGPISIDAGYTQEGQSLLYLLLKRWVLGPIPAGHDVMLHPTAFAGWLGLLVTMINLVPWGQLDGGHIAFALFGPRQHRYARWFRRALLLFFALNLVRFVGPALLGTSRLKLGLALTNSTFWLVWYLVLGLIGRVSGGADHPPFDPGALSPLRRGVAWLSLLLFVLLFMPTPYATYA